jgi:predicted RNA polymerase sigma factor
MNTDEVIEMARQAGFTLPEGETWYEAFPQCIEVFAKLVEDAAFKRWAAQTKLAVQDEREACAKAVENLRDKSGVNEDGNAWLTRITRGDCVNAIRARGETTLRGEA